MFIYNKPSVNIFQDLYYLVVNVFLWAGEGGDETSVKRYNNKEWQILIEYSDLRYGKVFLKSN